jgi:hypothetical protein
MSPRPNQRGEGKVGCFLTLVVFGILAATAVKIVPVFYSNNELVDTAETLAGRAGTEAIPTLMLQLQEKARTLEIMEALGPGAMEITTLGEKKLGTCTIHLKWTRKIDLYGAYVLNIDTDKTISRQYLDAR